MILEDIEALNKAVKLTGDRQLVPFSPVHVQMMELGIFDKAYLEHLPDWLGMLSGMATLGYAYTGAKAGKPMCCFGVIKLWPGVAEVWLIPDADVTSVARSFHRVTKLFFDIIMSELHLFRLQATVHTLNEPADKWIRSLYFQEEGVLRRFGPDGSDAKMYSRLRDDSNERPVLSPESPPSSARP
jgi:hypothetical protein